MQVKIAIIGIGCRLPGDIAGPEQFWDALLAGRDCTSEIPAARSDLRRHFDPDQFAAGKHFASRAGYLGSIDGFDAKFFGISRRDAEYLDPQQRNLLEVCFEGFEDAGADIRTWAGRRVGVFVGGFMMDNMLQQLATENVEFVDTHTATGGTQTMLSNRISHAFDFRGPSLSIDTACSGSLVALHLACTSLERGESELAVVAGSALLSAPGPMVAMSRGRFLAPDGRCKTFDASADGYARGEGTVVVLLKPLAAAIAAGDPVYAVISGTGVNQDGRTQGITVPSGEAQAALMREVYAAAGARPDEIVYVEAHGTGTPTGDPVEAHAIDSVVGDGRSDGSKCIVASVKTNIGHLEGAAGVAGLAKVALMLRHGMVPPHLNFREANPAIALESMRIRIPLVAEALPVKGGRSLVGINSFGYGGTNAHAVLENWQPRLPPQEPPVEQGPRILALSAGDGQALQDFARKVLVTLDTGAESLDDLGYALARRRMHHPSRLAIVSANLSEFRQDLAGFVAGKAGPRLIQDRVAPGERKLIMVFSGMGPIRWGMGRMLLERDEGFRATVTSISRLVEERAGWNLLEELRADAASSRLDQPMYGQPCNFALQAGLVEAWRQRGVVPAGVVGHSVGETAAAYAAGVYSLEDAVTVSLERSRAQQRIMGGGGMLAVALSRVDAARLAQESGEDVSLAAVNSPQSAVLSGEIAGLDRIRVGLSARGVFAKMLSVNVAYHSSQMDPLEHDLKTALRAIRPRPAAIELFSTALGRRCDGLEWDADYWWRNVRDTVSFDGAMAAVIERNYDVFLEVGPHPVLGSAIVECLAAGPATGSVVASIRRDQDELADLRTGMARLHCLGYPIDWSALYPDRGRFVRYPSYPWQHESFRLPRDVLDDGLARDSGSRLLGRRELRPRPAWQGEASLSLLPWLKDHRIDGAVVFPGAGYVDMALSAAQVYFGPGSYAIDSLVFEQALLVPEGLSPLLECSLDPGDGRFEICSRKPREPHRWTRHARGVLREATGCRDQAPLLSAAIRARCATLLPAEACYAELSRLGLDYGASFRNIREASLGPQECLAVIDVPDWVARGGDAHVLHPVLLDACFQALALAAAFRVDHFLPGNIFMPTGIGELRLFSAPRGRLYCHATTTAGPGEAPQGSLEVRDEAGEIVLAVDRVSTTMLAQASKVDSSGVEDILYETAWIEAASVGTESSAAQGSGVWIILADRAGCAAALAQRLRESGRPCLLVYAGPPGEASGERWVAPGAIAALDEIFAEVLQGGQTLQAVVHCWSLDAGHGERVSSGDLARATLAGAMALKHVARIALDRALSARIWVVTRGAMNIGPGSSLHHVAQAPVWGLAKVLGQQEAPLLWGGLVDLDPVARRDEAKQLFDEIHSGSGEDQVCLREGRRFVARLRRQSLRARPVPVSLRADGCYWVTGAFGALGGDVARWLAAKGARRIVLLGRSRLPERGAWPGLPPSHPSAAALRLVRELEAMGAQVLIAEVDVGDPESLRSYRESYERDFGFPIRGVVHCAGVVDDCLLESMTDDSWFRVASPKIFGAWNLWQELQDSPLDFFTLFSSAGSVLVSAGQGAYASANAFLDALAEHLHASGIPALSIKWGPWAEAGMAGSGRLDDYYEQRGIRQLAPRHGIRLLENLMGQGTAGSLVISVGSWAELRARHYPAAGSVPLLTDLIGAEGAPRPQAASEVKLRQALEVATPQERPGLLRARVLEIVAEVLRTDADALDASHPLAEYGVDSLLAMEISGRLEAALESRVSVLAVFLSETIGGLCDVLLSRLDLAAEAGAPAAGAAGSSPQARLLVTPPVPVVPVPAAAAAAAADEGVRRPFFNPFIADHSANATGRSAAALQPMAPTVEGAGIVSLPPTPPGTGAQAAATAGNRPPAPGDAQVANQGIAVIGMSGKFASAVDLDAFWETIVEGRCLVVPVDPGRWNGEHAGARREGSAPWRAALMADPYLFDPQCFGLVPVEARSMDPQQRQFLMTAWEALEDAGYAPAALNARRCGVFVGSMAGDYGDAMVRKGDLSAFTMMGNHAAMLPARLAHLLNLRGPCISIDSACSSSLVAVHLACQSILSGESDMAVAGAVFISSTPTFQIMSEQAGMLSPDGRCRTFDEGASGTVLGDGVGVVVLKRLDHALRDGDSIHGVIRASGVNQDGKTRGITSPSLEAQRDLETEVYRKAGIDPQTIGYVEAHGTGTRLGDPIEVKALSEAFGFFTGRKNFCALGAVKPNVGHAYNAAGMAGLIKVLLCMKHRVLPPVAGLEVVSSLLELEEGPFYIPRRAMPWITAPGTTRRAALSAFGYSGTNAHLVVDEMPPAAPALAGAAMPSPELVILSARSAAGLESNRARLAAFLAQGLAGRELPSLADLAYTLQVGRSQLSHRLAIVAASLPELLLLLGSGVHDERVAAGVCARGARADSEGLEALVGGGDWRQVANAWVGGADTDWTALRAGSGRRRVSLPPVTFDLKSYRYG